MFYPWSRAWIFYPWCPWSGWIFPTSCQGGISLILHPCLARSALPGKFWDFPIILNDFTMTKYGHEVRRPTLVVLYRFICVCSIHNLFCANILKATLSQYTLKVFNNIYTSESIFFMMSPYNSLEIRSLNSNKKIPS